jgi:hypothetical protein
MKIVIDFVLRNGCGKVVGSLGLGCVEMGARESEALLN